MMKLSQLLFFLAWTVSVAFPAKTPVLPAGKSDFRDIVSSNCTFIDKSMLIKDVMEDASTVTLITRPTGFGKSVGLSMLRHFLADNDSVPVLPGKPDIFQGTKIAEDTHFCTSHRNKHPLVHISFSEFNSKTYGDAELVMKQIVAQAFLTHIYIMKGDTLMDTQRPYYDGILNGTVSIDLTRKAIATLCEFLHKKTGKQVVLLIDDYDKPIRTAYAYGYLKEFEGIARDVIMFAAKDPRFVRKTVITGVGNTPTFAGLAMQTHTVLKDDRYTNYFGFSDDDVNELVQKTGLPAKQKDMKAWYGNYRYHGKTYYNPHSVVEFLNHKGKTGSYCTSCSDEPSLRRLVSRGGMNMKGQFVALFKNITLEKVLSGSFDYKTLESEERSFWEVMVSSGYLNAVFNRTTNETGVSVYSLSIPNEEVRVELRRLCDAAFSEPMTTVTQTFERFEVDLGGGNVQYVERFMQESLVNSGSFYDFKNKKLKSSFGLLKDEPTVLPQNEYLLELLTPLKDCYDVRVDRATEFDRSDVELIPRKGCKMNKSVLIEFQRANDEKNLKQTAETALKQIKTRHPVSEFKNDGVVKFIDIGVGVYRDKVSVCSQEASIN